MFFQLFFRLGADIRLSAHRLSAYALLARLANPALKRHGLAADHAVFLLLFHNQLFYAKQIFFQAFFSDQPFSSGRDTTHAASVKI